MNEIKGKDAEDFLSEQITKHHGGIMQALAYFDAEGTVFAWLDTIRAIEEFINLPLFCLNDDGIEQTIISLRLLPLNPIALKPIRDVLIVRFGEDITQRFVWTVIQAAAIGMSFRINGHLEAAAALQTVGHAIDYFQSRRRHLVALLYTLPKACRGRQQIDRLDTLNLFLPLVEYNGLTLTGLHEKIMLSKVFPDFKLLVDSCGFFANHNYEPLDSAFLDPERVGITEMLQDTTDRNIKGGLEPLDPHLIFSAAELRNNIQLIVATYAEFDLANTAFAPMAEFIRTCLLYCEDNYLINIPESQFVKFAENVQLTTTMLGQLIQQSDDYVANTNVFAPFICLSDSYVSTVTLLTRFLYHWKNKCLNRNRRFQIRSGFLLEDSVKNALSNQGFTITDIKRINRKEFDVVSVLGQVIYNVQCKNNFVDLCRIESNAPLFARYNRQLDRYYSQALVKEERREQLLIDKLGLTEIRHVIVSRFPIATANPRIIPYSRINHFKLIINNINW